MESLSLSQSLPQRIKKASGGICSNLVSSKKHLEQRHGVGVIRVGLSVVYRSTGQRAGLWG